MRSVLALGLLITLCASANAATVLHRSKPSKGHLRPAQAITVPNNYLVPGWTYEETTKWLNTYSSD